MPVLNDDQSPDALPENSSSSASAQWDSPYSPQDAATSSSPHRDEATATSRTTESPSTTVKTGAEEDARMAGIEASPIPSGAERVEVKDKESVETGPHTNSYATVQLRDDNWTSGFAIPGILPPPKRPQFSSSFLRPGSRFLGKQQSDKQIYNVEVTFKSVDIANSFLCGYLRIEGLTENYSTLTTYFEGEIIGTRYTFQTKHEKWGATEKTDMQHWNRFPAWRPLATQAKRADFHYKNFMDKENVFMRWKEYFLVPDHHVREIQGASFEGFYYICFNQVKGSVSGIYFHAKSEKFQQLELEHVNDLSGFAAIDFR